MLKAFKTEIKPTKEQAVQIHKTIGTCRFIYNLFIQHNKEKHEKQEKFVSAVDFSKWLNNEFIPNNQEYLWIKEVSSKAVKQSMLNADSAYKKFFKVKAGFPKFKKKKNQDVKFYFVRNSKKDVISVKRHKIKIPTLGYVNLKEKNYLPVNLPASSGTIEFKAGRYYISVLFDVPDRNNYSKKTNAGIGIDLGIKDFAIVSSIEKPFKNINKTKKVKKIKKKLKRKQRQLSRKYEQLKQRKKKLQKNEKASQQNIKKQIEIVQKIHHKLTRIRSDYINKTISSIIKQEPSFVTIEDLNIKGMMKNRHLSESIAQQKFYEFRIKLTDKCRQNKIELRIVDRFYPSSKKCSNCGHIKKDLQLKDRIYECSECRMILDRDKNASINLAQAEIYTAA